ncbi:DUF1824 family protein [Microcoleus sp. FACHB-672]|uniref:DUF1824 family protein n=1 Tax=Microcoleus sp. FACHB-672 TaxID=2692825 RepID=UPI001689010B|nr:DUF1824 family protein [Microcoleus sp. FACHB-672]MBD2041646.1 DUF1824 family protein [Microcoleus sp. FACHB-672]
MNPQKQANLTIKEAQQILAPFNCIETKSVESESEKVLIRQALLLLAAHSDYQILGICAGTPEQGLLALESYAKALGHEASLDISKAEGAVYIKFNPLTGLCYFDSYTGKHRGVLISCQSSYQDGINEMYGHLPLDLFILK